MRIVSGNKVNPLIGSAGVSAVPMAARVSQVVGLRDNPSNYLLMQAMGPNVAGVIGTAVAAGTIFGPVRRLISLKKSVIDYEKALSLESAFCI